MQVRTIPGNDQRQRLVIPCPEKFIAIVCMERPMDVKSIQGFLGSVNWFRRHIASHVEIQFPLNQLTRKDADWDWTPECETAWLTLKRKLMTFPGLRIFDSKLKTVLYTDSSMHHVGGVICQILNDESETLVVIAYYSRSLRGPELKYPIQQKEMLAIVACVTAFQHYLLCSEFYVRCCTDHKTLVSSFEGLSKMVCDRITRWVQKICIYRMKLFFLPGCDNHVADLLSRALRLPHDAWKSMDVIDSTDFVYAPLLYFEPGYIFSMNMHYGTPNVLAVLESEPEHTLLSFDVSEIEYLPEPAWTDTWTKVEQALYGITLAPIGSKVIAEADYF